MEWVRALLAGGGASFAAWKLGARRAVRREHAEELEGVRGEHSGARPAPTTSASTAAATSSSAAAGSERHLDVPVAENGG